MPKAFGKGITIWRFVIGELRNRLLILLFDLFSAGQKGQIMDDADKAKRYSTYAALAAGALGFALGGFFDGILLHQILQWHHLLSALPQAAGDLRFLVLTDGLFHLAMYAVAALGLVLLWRGRFSLMTEGAGRSALAWGLTGFGTWHIVDALLSHWLLGIHRIRMDSDMPLFWDILWLCLFGLVPVLLGIWIRRGSGSNRLRAAPMVLAAVTVAAGTAQAFPPVAEEGPVVVLFRAGMDEIGVMAAIEAVDGTLAGRDSTGTLWSVVLPQGMSARRLYAQGALVISGSGLPAGCLDYTQPDKA